MRYRNASRLLVVLAFAGWLFGAACQNGWAQEKGSKASETKHTETASPEAAHPDVGHGGEHASEPNPLAVDVDLAFWTFIVFLVLLVVLAKFAWKPIIAALEAREHHIAENIEAAKRAQDEAREMLAGYEKKLAGAADQVREMLDEARRDAEVTKGQIVDEAKTAAKAEHERAMRDIRTAADAAVKDLSQRSADLAIELAGKVISAKMTPDERSRLVNDSLSKFAATTPSKN
jgi:F-type H+-transporting ATPase subunit b